MNRNVQSHFALNPVNLDIPRSQFDRSSGVKFSANVGQLIPFYVDEVLPGDTFKIKSSKVVRLQTLVHPIMDNMYLDTYWFFVPNRLVWDNWKEFMGESDKAWLPEVPHRVPKLEIDASHPHPGQGSLMDYMGIPLGITSNTNSGQNPKGGINALPFRAYAKVCSDWFRSEVLTDPMIIDTSDADHFVNSKSSSDLNCALGGPVFTAAKYHDYFTSCLPAPQCGPSVRIPISTSSFGLPVTTGGNHTGQSLVDPISSLHWKGFNISGIQPALYSSSRGSSSPYPVNAPSLSSGIESSGIFPANLWAGADASMIGTINDLRMAFQVQKFYEKMSRGRRYIEILKAQFGVTSPDARLQRSEYLGGNRIPINVTEVTNNSASDSAVLGDLGAMSRTTDVHNDFVHSFTEHGVLLGLCVIRYDHSYPQGLDRFWKRTDIFDYYWPVFANLGEQVVHRDEINALWRSVADPNDIFGYQEAWADYRYKPSRVCGEMRPEATGSLASWHLADYYSQEIPEGESGSGPYLSDSWIREDKSNVDRVLAVTSAVSDQYIADFWIQNICTRVMPLYSIPGLADHH